MQAVQAVDDFSSLLRSWCSGRSELLVMYASNAPCCVFRTVGKDHEGIRESLPVQSGAFFQ